MKTQRRAIDSRSSHRIITRWLTWLAASGSFLLSAVPNFAQPTPPKPVPLVQGWTDTDRQWFYTTTQGSELMNYQWFMALEQPGSQVSFAADSLTRFGYLPNAKSSTNPDGLPVGFVADSDGSTRYIGMTCAACHTGQVKYNHTLFQIDGAPCRADLYAFLKELRAAVQETNADAAKFGRFADHVLGSAASTSRRDALHGQLDHYASTFMPYVDQSTPDMAHRWGPARADAFGMIFNRVAGFDLPDMTNYQVAAAPVSYPFLWGIAWHDKVQWNGSAPNTNPAERLARNVGEALGVFATLNLAKPGHVLRYYASSVNRPNLLQLEHKLTYLKAPKWPSQYFGAPDPAKVALGAPLYAQYCAASCHTMFNPDKPAPVKVFMDPLSEVKTDPAMVLAPRQRMANTDQLAGTQVYMYAGSPLKANDLVFSLVTNAVVGAVLYPSLGNTPAPGGSSLVGAQTLNDRQRLRMALSISAIPQAQRSAQQTGLLHQLLSLLTIYGQRSLQSEAAGPAYKARPLDGIWATAPYLHNGSVASLWELMLDESQRSPRFYVGSPEFDPVNVGLNTGVQSGFLFDTSLPGNHNTGHSGHRYGTDLPDDQKRAIVEYMKTL